jgi:NRAMP (natural resistance-associated macrophage protein)-like metal ion transporter
VEPLIIEERRSESMKPGKSFNFLEMSDYIARNSFSRLGPAFMVYVGCMDPGIWATAMGAGSRLGFELVWVLLSACAFSGLLQSLSTRLGLATGKNLAQVSLHVFTTLISIC